jgi:hypothetical protein
LVNGGRRRTKWTDNLLDDLTGGVQVNEALVDLQLKTIPGLGTFTTRLETKRD